jgi:DNA-binding beta-propeller fold protein YncE
MGVTRDLPASRSPISVAAGPLGNIYITDSQSHRVRHVYISLNTIYTVAGNSRGGNSGDGGPAEDAEVSEPWGVTFDANGGRMYIAQYGSNVIRLVNHFGPPQQLTSSAARSKHCCRHRVRSAPFSAPGSGTSASLSPATAITGTDGTAVANAMEFVSGQRVVKFLGAGWRAHTGARYFRRMFARSSHEPRQ